MRRCGVYAIDCEILQTGETQKYDGPYSIFIWTLYWSKLVPVVVVGKKEKNFLNMVPRDFVVDAIAYLSAQDHTVGQVPF